MNEKQSSAKSLRTLAPFSYEIVFESRLYSKLAVKKSAYKFAADFGIVFRLDENDDMVAEIDFPSTTSEVDQQALLRAFCGEVIDQDLREHIAAATEGTRNLILAEAFSKTSLLHEDG